MENAYALNPAQYRRFSNWHKLIAILLLLLLAMLWMFGYGPGAFRHCVDNYRASSDVERVAAPLPSAPPTPASTAATPPENVTPEPAKLSDAAPPVEAPKLESEVQPEPVATATVAPVPVPSAKVPLKAKVLRAAPSERIYFGVNQATLRNDADRRLANIIAFMKANPDARVSLAGFHDSSGRTSRNIELAKKRALAVADALEKAGVSASRIELQKPTKTRGSGSSTEARRVELKVMN